MQIDNNRLYNGYYLNDWGDTNKSPCNCCELSDDCDRLADDLNNIEYCMCLSKGVIKDTKFKKNHPDAYFKKIDKI